MPGRFSNLEFDDERRKEATEKPRAHGERDAWQHLERANASYRDGEYEQALRLYTRCLQEDRKLIRAWVGQVQMLVQLGECHEARVWSDKALELFRNNGDLLAAKAQACIRLKDRPTAMACSDGSMQSPGSSAWRWQTRGEILLARGDRHYEDCFQKSLAETGADWFDRVVIARIYRYYKRWGVAMDYMAQAVELQPGLALNWFELGECQQRLGLSAPAERSYQHCLDLRPDFR